MKFKSEHQMSNRRDIFLRKFSVLISTAAAAVATATSKYAFWCLLFFFFSSPPFDYGGSKL
jgi:hypothetical protein